MLNKSTLRCPCEKKVEFISSKEGLLCASKTCIHSSPTNAFKLIDEIPILISELNTDTVFDSTQVKGAIPRQENTLLLKIRKFLIGENKITKKNCSTFMRLINQKGTKAKVLIIGGGEIGSGAEQLYGDQLELTSCDIYISKYTDLISDGHYLPFKDQSFEGIWIQAVLEHVADPVRVTEEIHRTLKPDGVIYSEIPFIQQVHEGAYDFTRFTVVGHRYLFKKFSEVSIGPLKTAEDGLTWSFRYFIWSLTRSRFVAKIAGVTAGLILKPFAYILSKEGAYDSSSGSYFLGRKADEAITQKEALKTYKGLN